jgi:beta-glucosidase-like glycosyl hydrolase
MRMNYTMAFPKQITLGAIQDNDLIYRMGQEIARQCKRLGVHLNFAPVVDINSNPNNPIIGHRSFGELRENVAAKSSAYMRGMQAEQLLACAKHFPGHGDTHGDSHRTLPQLAYSAQRLKDMELYPFQRLINDSIKSVIVGHLQVPVYDWKPATLSPTIVTNLLKQEMGFKGLVITDALNMRGVQTSPHIPGGVDLQAFLAGNDILLYSENIPEGIKNQRSHYQWHHSTSGGRL